MFLLKHTCTGHRAAVYALAPGRDGRHVLSAGGDGWVAEWNLDDPETGRLIASVETQVFTLCPLPDGRLLAGNMNGGLHWIDREAPERTRNIQHHQKGVYDLLALGEQAYSAGGDGLLTRWSVAETRSLESLHLSNRALRSLAYSPARNELAAGASDNAIYRLDARTLDERHTQHAAHANSVFALAYSPDGRYLLSGGRDAMLRVWALDDASGMHPVSEQPAHWYTINHIVFSPDGSRFATASRDKTIKIWDATSFQLLKVLDLQRHNGHLNSVNRLLWLPGYLVSASDDRTVKIWEETL